MHNVLRYLHGYGTVRKNSPVTAFRLSNKRFFYLSIKTDQNIWKLSNDKGPCSHPLFVLPYLPKQNLLDFAR
jgi:hypothetical protein